MLGSTIAMMAARDTIMNLLSDDEVAKVSTAETAESLDDGAEYLDLEHLERGVQRAAGREHLSIKNVIVRSAVGTETWTRMVSHLPR